jgi:hypothetical protein
MSDTAENDGQCECGGEHEGVVIAKVDVPLEEGAMLLGHTMQAKMLMPDGRVAFGTWQTGDINDVEAMGMVNAHYLSLKEDVLGAISGFAP